MSSLPPSFSLYGSTRIQVRGEMGNRKLIWRVNSINLHQHLHALPLARDEKDKHFYCRINVRFGSSDLHTVSGLVSPGSLETRDNGRENGVANFSRGRTIRRDRGQSRYKKDFWQRSIEMSLVGWIIPRRAILERQLKMRLFIYGRNEQETKLSKAEEGGPASKRLARSLP